MHYVMVNVEQAVAAITGQTQVKTLHPNTSVDGIDWHEEKERIRIRLLEQLFSIPDKQQLQLLTDQYQGCLIRLMDQLYRHHRQQLSAKKATEEQSLYRLLHELLLFLKVHYAPFFNFSRKAPRLITSRVKRNLKSCAENMTRLLEQQPALSVLRPLLLQPFRLWLHAEDLCFADIRYAVFAYKKLAAVPLSAIGEDPLTAVKKMLISINFNTPAIAAFLTGELRALVDTEPAVSGKLRVLKLRLKEICQLITVPHAALNKSHLSLRLQLVNWLQDEICYYEQEQQLQQLPVTGKSSTEKIHTSLSVPQLAFLFRLLKEEKLITNNNQSELLKVVSSSFTTANREQFSYGHLHGTFYKIEAHTKRSVYDLLLRLLHQSKKIG